MSLEKPTSGDDLLAMSDDDIMGMTAPPASGEEEGKDKTNPDPAAEEEGTVDKTAEAEAEAGAEEDNKDPTGEGDDKDGADDQEGKDKKPEASAEGDDKDKTDKAPAGATDVKDPKEKDTSSSGSETTETSFKAPSNEEAQALFMKIMAPFKANGKMIQLKSPEEVIQLMQMGANYTRKLQDIQPHRKVLMMLQNNDLLDEGKLSFLIDLDKKNPEAIKKLIKDAGVDPMDIDTSSEPAYLEGNHRVSDEEAGFRLALDEMTSTQSGKETVQLINTDWDQASKEVLWQSPEIMSVIHEQRESGIYDLITTELTRQKTLGKISPNTPFLQAYKTVGDELAAAGALGKPGEAEKKEPVATTVAKPKDTVTNGDQASAASPTRTTARKAEKLVNPLALSDDEFLKQMENRL